MMKKRFFMSMLALVVMFGVSITNVSHAQGMTIDDAKTGGIVGEMDDGLLGVMRSSPEIEKLVSTVNKQRMTQYEQIAKQQGISVQEVRVIAGQKLLQRVPTGQFYKKEGKWIQK